MKPSKSIEKQIKETARLLSDETSCQEAARLSGEYLAAADAAWTGRVNTPGNSTPVREDGRGHQVSQELYDMLSIGAWHALALHQNGLDGDCFALTMLLLIAVQYEDAAADCPELITGIAFLGGLSLMGILGNIDDTEENRGHVETMMRYLASLAFNHQYISRETPGVWHFHSRQWLQDMWRAGLVQVNEVDVNGTKADPIVARDIISDLVGRASALGLIH